MNLTALAVLILAAAVVVLVVVLIPLIVLQMKTLASVDAVINGEVRQLLRSLNNTALELEGVARGAKEGVQKVDEALEAFRELGGTIRGINELIDKRIRGTLIDAISYLVGVKVGCRALVEGLKSHGKKEVD